MAKGNAPVQGAKPLGRPSLAVLLTLLGACIAGPAAAQLAPAVRQPPRQQQSIAAHKTGQLSKTAPVTFTADSVEYDRVTGVVVATGHVEAWQTDEQVRADKVTYDRNTGVMAATGHVQLIDPSGQVLFSDYAELTSNMREGIMRGMSALLAANGRLAATGARRTPGPINTLAKGIYSTCNLCIKHPERPPLWDLRARIIVQDVPDKRIEYYHAWLDVMGVPILYLPYFSNADPSVKRQSGFLIPSIGNSSHLGFFAQAPYYWVLGKSSDVTIVPELTSLGDAQVEAVYRRSFDNGRLRIDAGLAEDHSQGDGEGTQTTAGALQGFLFADGRFNFNDTWRYGFDINVASGVDYLRDFNVTNLVGNVLNTQLYAEGFGEGAYSKVSALSYQGLNSTVTNSQLPFVLPRYQFDYTSLPQFFGGRFGLDTDDFNVVRRIGTNDSRLNLNGQWERTGIGRLGDVWTLTGRFESVAYNAYDLNQQPNYDSVERASTVRIQPTAAVKVAWPFLRAGRDGSSELIEPIVQLVAAPNTGSTSYDKLPDEDSLAPEFSDTTLFSLNRFIGSDRQEGGLRANVGLHGTWTTKIGVFDALVGQSYRLHEDDVLPSYVGLARHASDVVGRATYTPNKWFDLTTRVRVDHTNLDIHYAEAVASAGPQWLRFSAGYIYSQNTPYFLDYQPSQGDPNEPRNEIQGSVGTHFGRFRVSGFARRDLQHSQMVDAGGDAAYEDECTIVEMRFYRRYTSINNDHGDSTVQIQITLKTVGAFGFHAL